MSDPADASFAPAPPVRVSTDCSGPVNDDCEHTIVATVPGFADGDRTRGVRCSECAKIAEARREDVIGGGA